MRTLVLMLAVMAVGLTAGCTSEDLAQLRGAAWDVYYMARDAAWYVYYW
jgi:hypothetical protein